MENAGTAVTIPVDLVKKAQQLGFDVSKSCKVDLQRRINAVQSKPTPSVRNHSKNENDYSVDTPDLYKENVCKSNDEEILREFEKVCRIDKNLSDATIDKHLRYVGRFLESLEKHPRKATSNDIREHLTKYEEEGKPGARQGATKSLRVFFRDFMNMDIAKSFEVPSLANKKVELPAKEELQTFYDSILNDKYRALFLVYASSGLRANEVLELTLDDVNFEKRMLKPKNNSKTKKSYISFYNEEAEELLEKFLPKRKENDERLFQTGHHSVWKSFKRTSKRSGVKITAQLLRKWFCSEMGRLGVPDRYVDAYCGRVPKTVLGQHYTDFSPDKLKNVYDKAGIKVLN